MTAHEWLQAQKPKPMLEFLIRPSHPRVQDLHHFPDCIASDRKLRLFACACHARVRHVLTHPLAERVVVVAEEVADGHACAEDLHHARNLVWLPLQELEPRWRASAAAERQVLAPIYESLALAGVVAWGEPQKAGWYAPTNASLAQSEGIDRWTEEQAQAHLLRCMFGNLENLLKCPEMKDTWRTPTVTGIATTIYDQRCFEEMPILGDALEDAGCDHEPMLRHCRSEGPHVRGCWVVDLVLGKE